MFRLATVINGFARPTTLKEAPPDDGTRSGEAAARDIRTSTICYLQRAAHTPVWVSNHLEACDPSPTARCEATAARLASRQAWLQAHPHMFRHACGFELANQGTDTRSLQAYLGHRNIQHSQEWFSWDSRQGQESQ